MVHNNKLVATVMVNDSHLREYKNNGNTEVFIPFGSEYSIYFKNLNSRRAVVDVSIDGESVINGLVIDANSESILTRSFKGDLNKGYTFKFIEKSDKVREHRGERPLDGLITINYRFEIPQESVTFTTTIYSHPYRHHHPANYPYHSHETIRSFVNDVPNTGMYQRSAIVEQTENNYLVCSGLGNDDGITVEGSDSYQRFNEIVVGELEQVEYSIVIHLKGDVGQKKIANPIVTRKKVLCKNCGTSNLSGKYCPECGTNMTAC